MTAERTNAKIHIEGNKPLNEYDAAIRKQKNRSPIYLDHCLAYVNSRVDFAPEVRRTVIKKLKSNPVNLFNDIYPKLDSMLKRASIELTRQKSNRVNKIAKTVDQQIEQITNAQVEDIFDSLHEQQEDVVPAENAGEENSAQVDPAEDEVNIAAERAAQENLEKDF